MTTLVGEIRRAVAAVDPADVAWMLRETVTEPLDAPLIAYQQNQGQVSHPTLAAGMRVRARRDEAGNRVVRD